jgi:hypothetical protein
MPGEGTFNCDEHGQNLVKVELTNIKVSGVLTYTLTSGDFTASMKMVVVK